MRALVIGAAERLEADFIRHLAAGCDFVIAADGGGASCLAAGIVPNILVGDFDSLPADAERRIRGSGTAVVTLPVEKDLTDLDVALDVVRERRADEVWLTGVLGGRLDHSLASVGSIARSAGLRPMVREPDLTAWLLSGQGRHALTLCGTNAVVSIFAVQVPACITCSGLRYPLDRDTLRVLDSRGISNVIDAASATVTVHSGVVLVLSILTDGTPPASERSSDAATA